MTHMSLFTGIGGIDIAAEWAGFETIGQCEFADYPNRVLEKHWPDVPRWRDIRDVTGESFRERTNCENPTILSGGFPCQPHSLAGKRMASGDERDLWDEFARCIREIKPRWVLGENVLGILSSEDGRFFGRVLRDLAQMGYRAGWASYPASWVGAIHRRERVFIVAHANGERLQRRMPAKKQQEATEQFERIYISLCRYADKKRLSASFLHGGNHGVSARVDRSKCLGNAVVPQQVFPILAAIASIEREATS